MDATIVPVALTMLKSVAIYLFIIIAIRIFGKKELAQLSVVDLVFILLISNSVQNAMVGTTADFYSGLAAAISLFVVNYVFKLLIKKSPAFSKVVQGEPLMLIYKGKIKLENMEKAMFTVEELEAAVREHGVEKISNVDLAVLEADGNISVLSHDYRNKSVRKITGSKPAAT